MGKIVNAAGHYAYLLRCSDGTIYCGYTTDPRRARPYITAGGARNIPVRACPSSWFIRRASQRKVKL